MVNFSPGAPRSSLIEPGVHYFLYETLHQSNLHKKQWTSILINIGLFITFCIVIGMWLWVSYKDKQDREIQKKSHYQYQEQMNKIMNTIESVRKEEKKLITDLPEFKTEFDLPLRVIENYNFK